MWEVFSITPRTTHKMDVTKVQGAVYTYVTASSINYRCGVTAPFYAVTGNIAVVVVALICNY